MIGKTISRTNCFVICMLKMLHWQIIKLNKYSLVAIPKKKQGRKYTARFAQLSVNPQVVYTKEVYHWASKNLHRVLIIAHNLSNQVTSSKFHSQMLDKHIPFTVVTIATYINIQLLGTHVLLAAMPMHMLRHSLTFPLV